MDYQNYLSIALACAKQISIVFTEGFYSQNNIEWKSEKDPVTEYDKKIEQISREFILDHYPDHIILGEEDGLYNNNNSDFKWIIDPIDGTINYIRGIPFVAYSLALLYQDEIVISVVSNPILEEYFWAVKGQGAYLNNNKIQVSMCDEIEHCYLAFGTYKEKYVSIYHELIQQFQSIRNPGSAALALAYIASGRMNGAVYFKLSPWDMAGGVLLVTEAGGKVNNINSIDFSLDNFSIIASSSIIHSQLNKIVTTL